MNLRPLLYGDRNLGSDPALPGFADQPEASFYDAVHGSEGFEPACAPQFSLRSIHSRFGGPFNAGFLGSLADRLAPVWPQVNFSLAGSPQTRWANWDLNETPQGGFQFWSGPVVVYEGPIGSSLVWANTGAGARYRMRAVEVTAKVRMSYLLVSAGVREFQGAWRDPELDYVLNPALWSEGVLERGQSLILPFNTALPAPVAGHGTIIYFVPHLTWGIYRTLNGV